MIRPEERQVVTGASIGTEGGASTKTSEHVHVGRITRPRRYGNQENITREERYGDTISLVTDKRVTFSLRRGLLGVYLKRRMDLIDSGEGGGALGKETSTEPVRRAQS